MESKTFKESWLWRLVGGIPHRRWRKEPTALLPGRREAQQLQLSSSLLCASVCTRVSNELGAKKVVYVRGLRRIKFIDNPVMWGFSECGPDQWHPHYMQ